MSEAIHAREKDASHARCPFCHEEFSAAPPVAGDERVTCTGCGTPHHAECFGENGGCSSLGCDRRVAKDARGVERTTFTIAATPVREGASTAIIVLGLLLLVGSSATSQFGNLPTICGAFLIVLGALMRGFVRAAPPEVADDARPIPLAQLRAPVHGVEVLQQMLERPVSATPPTAEDRAEPTGAKRPCPACSQELEGADSLQFCYHCGASLS